MKSAERGSPREPWSRRRFLASAVAGTAAMTPGVNAVESGVDRIHGGQTLSEHSPEEALARFGSEFGNIRRPR